MGGVINSIFGGGGKQKQKIELDEFSRELNSLLLDELRGLFDVSPYAGFAEERPDLFSLDALGESLLAEATGSESLMTIDEYLDLGLDQGSSFISQIARPEILSTLALQGQEGSGAVGENIAKATAGIALPFLSTLPQAAPAFASQASGLINLSQINKALAREDFLRTQGVTQTAVTGIPFTSSPTTTQTQRQLPLFNLFGLGSTL